MKRKILLSFFAFIASFFFIFGVFLLSFLYKPTIYKSFITHLAQKYSPYTISFDDLSFTFEPNLIITMKELQIQDKNSHSNYTMHNGSFMISLKDLLYRKLVLKEIIIHEGDVQIFMGETSENQEKIWENQAFLENFHFIESIEKFQIQSYSFQIFEKERKYNIFIDELNLEFPNQLKNFYDKTKIDILGYFDGAFIDFSIEGSIEKEELIKNLSKLGFNEYTYSFLYEKTNFESKVRMDHIYLGNFSSKIKKYFPDLDILGSFFYIENAQIKKKVDDNLYLQAILKLKDYKIDKKKNSLKVSFSLNYNLARDHIFLQRAELNCQNQFSIIAKGNYFFKEDSYFQLSSNYIDYDLFFDFLMGFTLEYESEEDQEEPAIVLDISVKKFLFQNLLFESLATKLLYENEILSFQDTKADFYGGKVNANLFVNIQEEKTDLEGNLSVEKVDIKKLISVFSNEKYIRGLGNGRLSFHSKFYDENDFLSNLKADGEVYISHFDLDEKLDFKTRIITKVGSLLNVTQIVESNTIFLSYFVNKGSIYVKEIVMDTRSIQVDGSGSIGFDGKVDINLLVEYGGSLAGNILQIPVRYFGNINDELKLRINFLKPVFRGVSAFNGSALLLSYVNSISVYSKPLTSPLGVLFVTFSGAVLGVSVYDYFFDIFSNIYTKKYFSTLYKKVFKKKKKNSQN